MPQFRNYFKHFSARENLSIRICLKLYICLNTILNNHVYFISLQTRSNFNLNPMLVKILQWNLFSDLQNYNGFSLAGQEMLSELQVMATCTWLSFCCQTRVHCQIREYPVLQRLLNKIPLFYYFFLT